ncbi:Chromatin modification- protein meaf6, partial [Coemansia spiralis]
MATPDGAAPPTAAAKGDETPEKLAKERGPTANGSGSKAAKGEGKVTKKMLKEAEQELFQLLVKKKQADRNLIDTETAIYDFETSYFESS